MKSYVIIFLLSAVLVADDYKSIYYEGFAKFNSGDYKQAAVLFEKAYALNAHPQIAYYAAYSFYNMNQEAKCKDYARKALAATPPLGKNYRENLDYFLRYWDARKEIERYDIKFKVTLSKDEKTISTKTQEDALSDLSLEERSRLMNDFATVYHGIPNNYEFYSQIRKTVQDTSRHYNTGYNVSGYDNAYGESEKSEKLDFLFPIDSLTNE